MPELPEVEVVRRGLQARLSDGVVRGATVREPRLRWPVPAGLGELLAGRRLAAVGRRGKYLLLELDGGTLIVVFEMLTEHASKLRKDVERALASLEQVELDRGAAPVERRWRPSPQVGDPAARAAYEERIRGE